MQVVLKKDFRNLGYKDDVVVVKDGYGYNFLLPYGIADFATDSNKKVAAENRKQSIARIEKLRSNALSLVGELEKSPVEIVVKLSSDGSLLQKITSKMVVDVLNSRGSYGLHEDSVVFKTKKIDQVGSYEVSVKLYRDVSANVQVVLKKE